MKELLRKKGRVLRRDSLTFAMLVFELILFVIVLLLGIRLYGQYRGQIYDNFVDSNVSVLDSVVNRNENEMSVMNTVVSQIAITPEARDFLLEEKPKRAEQLIQRLSEYSAVSSSFSMILYVNHNDHYVCNQRSSAEIDLFLRKGLLLEDTPASKFRKYLYDSSKKMIVLPEQGISGYFIQTMTFSERASLLLMTVQPDKEYTILFVLPEGAVKIAGRHDSVLAVGLDDTEGLLQKSQRLLPAFAEQQKEAPRMLNHPHSISIHVHLFCKRLQDLRCCPLLVPVPPLGHHHDQEQGPFRLQLCPARSLPHLLLRGKFPADKAVDKSGSPKRQTVLLVFLLFLQERPHI